jgi:hypothetical protein
MKTLKTGWRFVDAGPDTPTDRSGSSDESVGSARIRADSSRATAPVVIQPVVFSPVVDSEG